MKQSKNPAHKVLSLLLCLTMLMTLFQATPAFATGASDAVLYDMKTDDLTNPIGIDNASPVFSWKMQSDTIGQAQTAYHIVVSEDPGLAQPVWDSGEVPSGLSTGIAYEGGTLKPSTVYYWQVTVQDKDGKEAQSEIATFETGLMDERAWDNVQWISVSEEGDDLHYTIEVDMRCISNAVSLLFGATDESHFYMWQLSTVTTSGQVVYKPHIYTGSFSALTEHQKTVTDLCGGSVEALKDTPAHMLIDVTASMITTYINGTLVDECPVSNQIPAAIGKLGIRTTDTGTEKAYLDNIVLTDYTENSEGVIKCNYTFDDGVNPFGAGSIENGELYATKTDIKLDTLTEFPVVEEPEREGTASFRKDFEVKEGLASARLYSTGLGVYDAFLNGERVGRMMPDGSVQYDELKPGYTETQVRKFYYTYDVTSMLQEGGLNTLSAWVTNGWWSGYIVNGRAGNNNAFAAKLLLTYEDGTQQVLCTDSTWKGAYIGPMVYGDIYNGETYDATQSTDWMLPGFDDSSWRNVQQNREYNGTISAHVGPTVQIREDLERQAQSISVYDGVDGAAEDRYGTVHVVRTYQAGEEVVLNPGETAIVDMGQNFAGWEQFTVSGARGTTVKVRHAEILNDREGLISRGNDGPEGSIYTTVLRTALCTTQYILSGEGMESYHPTMTYYGFRYLEITTDAPVTLHSITGQVVTSVTEDSGSLETSNSKVNKLISNIMWSQYSNYLSVPTDCPQRDERYGWCGDTQVFAITGAYNSVTTKSFLQKWLQDLRDSQLENGSYWSVAPRGGNYGNNNGRVGWADAGVIVPYNMYLMTGDKRILEEQYDSMQLYMDSYLASTDKKGGDQGYSDWLAPEGNDQDLKNILGVAYYAWDAQMMSEMAQALGKTEDAEQYAELYEMEKAYFIEQFVKEDGSLISDKQTACLFALFLDLLPDENSVRIVTDTLVENIQRNGNHLQTGFLGTSILMKALSEAGLNELAYQLLLQNTNPSWLYSVENGATTIWERWDSYTVESGMTSSNRSLNHYSYGCVAEWMYSYMAGIQYDPEQPGFKHIILQPTPDQLMDSASATYDSVYGPIESGWAYDGGTLLYDASIPANTTATVYLPVEQLDTLTVNGKSYADVTTETDGIVFAGLDGDVAVFEAVAGSFHFASGVTEQTYLSIDAGEDFSIPSYVRVNGGEKQALPLRLKMEKGEQVTLSAVSANDADYQACSWQDTEGNVLASEPEFTYTLSENAELTVDFAWCGLKNLATGAAVTAPQVNDTWKASNLTDGALNHVGGTKGWSSNNRGSSPDINPVDAVIDLRETKTFNRFHLYPRTDAFLNGTTMCFPTSYTISVSDDQQTWTDVYSVEDGEVGYWGPVVVKLEQAASGRYVRIHFTKINQIDDHEDAYVQLAEFGVYYEGPEAAEPSIEAERESVAINEMFAFTAITPDDVKGIALFNEYDLKVSTRELSCENRGDGTLVWSGKTAIGTAGNARTLSLATIDAQGVYSLTDASFTVQVTRPQAQIFSAEVESTGLVNQPVTLTVVTNTEATKIAVRNENGLSMGILSQHYNDTAEGRVWTIQIRIGTRGTRHFEVFAKNVSGELSGPVTTNPIIVTEIA